MLKTGDVIGGRYRVERMLGMGGFGVVAAATHLELRTEVAIKMIRPELVDDVETIERFLREARSVAQLRTEHVCRVFDIGRTEQGLPYIVMELLQGADVASLLRSQPLPVHTAVDYIRQACEALAEAHDRNIVHRDLKPPNLFVTRLPNNTSILKVLDFGIAKAADELRLTQTKITLGSPQYMSPEQLTTPKDVDARTDIWSIGVTLYHMLARRLPFPSAQMAELAVMILRHPPAPIAVDPGLVAILFRCLEKHRDARFQDVRALSAALAPYAQRAPVAEVGSSRPPQMPGAPPQMPSHPHAAPPQAQTLSAPPQAQTMSTGQPSHASMPPHAAPPMPHAPMAGASMPGAPHASMAGAPHASMPGASMPGAPHASMAGASMPGASMPGTTLTARPTKSRGLLFGALAVAVIGGGAAIGYVALANKPEAPAVAGAGSARGGASPDAAVMAVATPDAAVVVATAPVDAAVVGAASDAALVVPGDAALATPSVDASVATPSVDAAVATPSVDAAVATPPVDAAVVVAKVPVDAAPRRPAETPPSTNPNPATSSAMELELAKLEGRISATPKVAPEYPSLMMSATQLACIVGDKYKARRYFVEIANPEFRDRAAEACRAYKIDL